jgi:hypothetical protein
MNKAPKRRSVSAQISEAGSIEAYLDRLFAQHKSGRGAPGRCSEAKRAHLMRLAEKRRGSKGNHHSPETRAAIGRKVSIALTGRKMPPEQREALSRSLRGRKLSPEHREALSRSLRGRKLSPEHVEAMRAWWRDHPEAKTIVAERMKGFRFGGTGGQLSAATRAKISASMKNVAKAPEHAAKLRAILREINYDGLPQDILDMIGEVAEQFHYNDDSQQSGAR